MKTIIWLVLFFPFFSLSQGIHFEHGLTWNQINEMAVQQDKYIFIDAYTTWCGPCKMMSSQVFTQDAVGKFFNENFINVKVQLDVTPEDNEEVKRWYADAKKIETGFNVNAYPTFLFVSPEGKLVHKIVGGSGAEEFIIKSSKALNPATQYFTQLEKYQSGERNPSFLYSLAIGAQEAYDVDMTKRVADDYLNTQTDYFNKENASFILRFTESTRDKGFSLLLANAPKFDNLLGSAEASNRVVDIIKSEEIFERINENPTLSPDWKSIESALQKKYPLYASEATLGAKVAYYEMNRDWSNYAITISPYMNQFSSKFKPEILNSYAWTVFENINEKELLIQALEWSKRSFSNKENPSFIDTYANLLYKLGRKSEAVAWQQKAIDLAGNADKPGLENTLQKMKMDIKTWPN